MAFKSIRLRESAQAIPRLRERNGIIESEKSSDGTFRIRIITEGKGSSGYYSRKLIQEHGKAFDGFKSFFDHPDCDFAPEERSVLKLAGKLVPGTIEIGDTEDGLAAVYARFKPREEYRQFFEDFGDVLGISIYVDATFSEAPDGTRYVESFDANDPYGSVDVVVAAGRGGRFEAARESLRTIESSLGIAERNKPTVEASAEETGNNMTKEEFKALIAEALAPIVADVAALKTTAVAEADADATAAAVDTAVSEARKSVAESLKLIAGEEDLLESQRTALIESVAAGKFEPRALEDAKAFAAEAKAKFATEGGVEGFVFEDKAATENASDATAPGRVAGW